MTGIGDPWESAGSGSKRLYRRVFRLNDRIERLEEELRLARAELERHRLIDEDARRDAAVGNYIDREEADLTGADVRRFEMVVTRLEERLHELTERRDRVLRRLPD